MSGQPVRPRSRELEIVRVLFDKHLLERAVNLAEARWAGSGEMVRLAYQWQDMGPAERRHELERIGPQQLAQFRALADLDPELAKVLDTLEERGVLPPVLASGSSPVAHTTYNPEIAPLEDVLEVESSPAVEEAAPPPEPAPVDVETGADHRDDPAGGSGWSPDLPGDIEKLFDGKLPELDLSNASLSDFAESEQARRTEAVASGEELLQRVRDRLNSSARRVTSNPIGTGSSSPALPVRMPPSMTTQTGSSGVMTAAEADQFAPPPDFWLKRLREDRVVVVDASTQPPSDDQLVALANELSLGLAEFVVEAGLTRQLFGGLKRSGSGVDVQIGPLPSALAGPSLVVVRGRLFPRIEERLRAGMCDIPGTRATVRLDPRARILMIP